MTASEFNSINDIHQRANIIWEHGKPVDERVNYREHTIVIYSVFDFYVEIWLAATTQQIEKVHAPESDDDWKSFLDSVKLKSLM